MANYQIEKIKPQHDAAICQIIKAVGEEYGAIGEGFGPSDAEVLAMSQHYNEESSDDNNSCYFVATIDGEIVGGGGIAAFNGSATVCELRKLFLLPGSRGLGLGQALTQACLDYAQSKGFTECYLDTVATMKEAIALYQKLGFTHLDQPFGGSIHGACDVWMIKSLIKKGFSTPQD